MLVNFNWYLNILNQSEKQYVVDKNHKNAGIYSRLSFLRNKVGTKLHRAVYCFSWWYSPVMKQLFFVHHGLQMPSWQRPCLQALWWPVWSPTGESSRWWNQRVFAYFSLLKKGYLGLALPPLIIQKDLFHHTATFFFKALDCCVIWGSEQFRRY